MIFLDFTQGLNKLWTEDYNEQRYLLRSILENIRGLKGEALDNLLEYIIKEQMFYVPNDIFMCDVFGEEVKHYSNGIYFGDVCNLCYRLAMPVRLLDNTVIGFIGYTNKDDFDDDNNAFIKYRYPPKYILQKNKYIYITRDEFKKAIDEQYICIVDGLFDQKSLEANGINAVSLCGSSVTEFHKLYLNSIKHKVIIADNDEAGRNMASYIKSVWTDAVEITQSETKDIDSFLHTPDKIKELKNLINTMKLEGFILNHRLKPERFAIRKGD